MRPTGTFASDATALGAHGERRPQAPSHVAITDITLCADKGPESDSLAKVGTVRAQNVPIRVPSKVRSLHVTRLFHPGKINNI